MLPAMVAHHRPQIIMKPAVLVMLVCIAVIVAGPHEYATLAAFGMVGTVLGVMLTEGYAFNLLGLAFIGAITFAGRAILRVLTGYGALVRLPRRGQSDGDGAQPDGGPQYAADGRYEPDDQGEAAGPDRRALSDLIDRLETAYRSRRDQASNPAHDQGQGDTPDQDRKSGSDTTRTR